MKSDAESTLRAASWPHDRAAEALRSLAVAARLEPRELTLGGERSADPSTLAARLDAFAAELDLDLTAVEVPYAEANTFLSSAAPSLLRLEFAAHDVRLAALVGNAPRMTLLAPDGTRMRVEADVLRSKWCASWEAQVDAHIGPVLDAAGLASSQRVNARQALLSEHLGAVPVAGAWNVGLPPGRPFLEQARRARLPGLAIAIALAGFFGSALSLLAWIPFGRGALAGRIEPAWLCAWALLLVSVLPLRWLEQWLQSVFGVRLGTLLRRRLMVGAVRLDPQSVRGEGAGTFLGRVLESEALEALLLGGGFVLIGALIDLSLAAWVLTHGPSPFLAPLLFAAWIAIAVGVGVRHLRRARAAGSARIAMTRDLVERMVGQRTRVVQEPREHWHAEEDDLLREYVDRARALDKVTLALLAIVGGGWMVSGASVVGAAFVGGNTAPIDLALGLGALLLGQASLNKLCSGLIQLSSCAVAWRQVEPLFEAAARREEVGLSRAMLSTGDRSHVPETELEMRGVSFRHPSRERGVLSQVDLEVHGGERVLVLGPSGGGKSTLVSLLAGWRTPSTGLVLMHGLDRKSHGAARWRELVAAAPQFHENHVFTGTLGFNLCLGAGHSQVADQELEAQALEIATELGLGGLIDRMPSGLRQIVGETGWQLSHGERSRLFVARALVADASLVVLDESLAALDPDTARRVLECVERRARSLVVVAHP